MEYEIKQKIVSAFPDAQVSVTDTKGGDHFEVFVASDAFKGKRLIQQHQMIMDLFKDEFKGPIHAFSLKTKTISST